MATKPHKSLTGSDLHEPKGVELAAPGQVYVSNGAGSGSWQTVDVQAAWSTGDVKLTYKTTPDVGFIMLGENVSIGNTPSAATFAGSGYHDLFVLLWNVVPASMGLVTPTRGGSAESDWAANKVLRMPAVLGRALAIAGSGAGLTPRQVGTFTGEETHALTSAENGPHTHAVSGTTGSSLQDLNHSHTYQTAVTTTGGQPGGTPGMPTGFAPAATAYYDLTSHSHNFSTVSASSGLGQAHNNMQPTTFLNAMIKV